MGKSYLTGQKGTQLFPRAQRTSGLAMLIDRGMGVEVGVLKEYTGDQ